MASVAILFAGQGGQYEKLGCDWLESYPLLQKYTQNASEALGYDLFEVMQSTDGRINETLYAQPAIVVQSLMAYQMLLSETHIRPAAFAGFSLGEYTALIASRVFSYEAGLKILKIRAEAMQACATLHPGAMAAVLGLDNERIETVCSEVSHYSGLVVPANYNCPNQLVISGDKQAVETACEQAKTAGAKRCIMLNVSGAFHSPLMKEAADALELGLKKFTPQTAIAPLYSNVTGKPYIQSEIQSLMVKQMTSAVLFEQTIRHMMSSGITHFIEIGPGSVLSGFVKKINPDALVTNLDKASQIATIKGWLLENGINK